MSKAVMLSVRPKFCELIASGKKTIEVRKTKPKIETPFKCYIYCTKPSRKHQTICGCMVLNDDELYRHPIQGIKYGDSIELMLCDDYTKDNFLNGKVIGEFVCDGILPMSITYSDPNHRIASKVFPYTCLTDKQIIDYLGNGQQGYGWHISDLVIYDNPKELREFCIADNKAVQQCSARRQAYYAFTDTGYIKNGFYCEEKDDWCVKCKRKPLNSSPRSWCYVEEVNE